MWMQKKTQRIDDSSSSDEAEDDEEDALAGALTGIPQPNNAGRSFRTKLPSTQQGPPQGFKRPPETQPPPTPPPIKSSPARQPASKARSAPDKSQRLDPPSSTRQNSRNSLPQGFQPTSSLPPPPTASLPPKSLPLSNVQQKPAAIRGRPKSSGTSREASNKQPECDVPTALPRVL